MQECFPLVSVTAISISGSDRLKWFNNLVTNDLKKLSDQQAVECFIADVKGRTLSHGIVVSDRESFVYVTWGRDQAAKLLPHLNRYIIRENVDLTDDSTRWQWSFIRRESLASHLHDDRYLRLEAMAVESLGNSTSAIAIACPAIGEDWLLVRSSFEDLDSKQLLEPMETESPNDASEFDSRRIRNRWPRIGIDFDDKNLPQELARDVMAISFNKGCYLGQETIARLDALGQVQKKLVLLSISSSSVTSGNGLTSGAILKKDDKEAGVITSIAKIQDSDQFVALAYVRRAFFAVGTELDCLGHLAVVQT
ncbi:MAG: hypothetical protein SGI77_15685 [Pirellulaceae bacterium]|nr:hypothetical protein [Pirellulaceae bacterium]